MKFEYSVPVVVIGAGACGLSAALAAKEAGAPVLVLERDARPSGSTALSTGLIPAAGTRFQRALGIEDSPQLLAEDIWRKAKGQTDRAMVETVARASGPTVKWLADRHGVQFRLVEGFLYPGHSVLRMHGTPPLAPPFCAVKVTGALFHTQGGLVIDPKARVLRKNGEPLPNLFAGGGAARGLSGPSNWGYFSGGGLLTATTLGRIAGESAAAASSMA